MVLVGQTCVNSNDGWSSVEILRLTFGQYFDPEVFEAGPWSRFWNKSLVTTLVGILRLKFGHDFEAEGRLIFWSWILVNLWYDLKAVTLLKATNLWVPIMPLAMFYLIACDVAIKVNQYLIFILIACEQLERGDYKDSDCDLRRTSLGEMIKKMMTEMVTKMVTIISMMMMITTWEEPAWAGLLRILSTAAIVAVSTGSGRINFLHLDFTINQILEQTIRQIDAHIIFVLLLMRRI